MTIKEIHDWVNFLTDKASGSYFSIEEIDKALDRAQMQYFNSQYSAYALAQRLQDSLAPFKSKYPFLTSDTAEGLVSMPSDYQYLLGGQITIMEGSHVRQKPLRILSEDEISYRLESQLRPVTASKPVATMAGKVSGITLIQLYPKQPMAGEVYYLRRPVVPVFGYTASGRVITYNPSTSTQMEWAESDLNEIMIRAIGFLGISVDDETITQYSEVKSKQVN